VPIIIVCNSFIAINLVTPEMVLKENIGSDRSWVYTATADVSDGVPVIETLAIRFGNPESILYS